MLLTPPFVVSKGKRPSRPEGPPALEKLRTAATSTELLKYAGALRAEILYNNGVAGGLGPEYVAILRELVVAYLDAAKRRAVLSPDGETVALFLTTANAIEVYRVAQQRYAAPGGKPDIPTDAVPWCEFAALETAVCAGKAATAADFLGLAEEAASVLLPQVPSATLFWRGRAAARLAEGIASTAPELALRYWMAARAFLEDAGTGASAQLDAVNAAAHTLCVQQAKTALARGAHMTARGKIDEPATAVPALAWPEPSARASFPDTLRLRFQRLLVAQSDAYWAPKLKVAPAPDPALVAVDVKTLLGGIDEATLVHVCRDKSEARRVILAALRGRVGERLVWCQMRGEIDAAEAVEKLLARIDEGLAVLFAPRQREEDEDEK